MGEIIIIKQKQDLSTTTAPPRFLLAKLGVVGAAGLGLGAAGASYMAKVLGEDLGWFHYVPEDDDDDDDDDDENADAAKKADDDDKDDEDDSGRDKKGNGKDKTSNNTIGVQFAGIGDLPLGKPDYCPHLILTVARFDRRPTSNGVPATV